MEDQVSKKNVRPANIVQKDLAIVVPLYRPFLDEWERLSLGRLAKVCSGRNFIFAGPEGLRNTEAEHLLPSGRWRFFSPWFFRSTYHYTWLLLSHKFYDEFRDFHSILIHQTDAFLFRDELDDWIGRYSYVGGPWRFKREFGDFSYAVGNGGLSLRVVDDHLNALMAAACAARGGSLPSLSISVPGGFGTLRIKLAALARMDYFPIHTASFVRHWSSQEDVFFGLIAPRLGCNFSIPGVDVAAAFSLDEHPKYFFERYCRGRLPMGFHALGRDDEPRYSVDFWEAKIRGAVGQ